MESTITSKIATSTSEGLKVDQFFDFSYWFGYPGPTSLGDLWLLIALAGMLLALALFLLAFGILRKNLSPPHKKFLIKLGWWLLSFSTAAWLLIGLRFLGIVFVSVRFAWIVWLLALAFVTYSLIRFYSRKLPQQVIQYQSYLIKRKYFPGKKKRK